MEQTTYGIRIRLKLPYTTAVERTREALKSEGFGVLTEIDVRRTIKEKLGADFRDYVILGACNPPLAHRALAAETEVGLLLPCNVIIYAEDGETVVSAIDPQAMMQISQSKTLRIVAVEAGERLRRALQRLEQESSG